MRHACCCLLIFFLPATLHTPSNAAETIDFARDVQPIFEQHCADCHGAEEQSGSLSFEDPASVFAQSDSGARAVVAGEPSTSELLKRVASTDDEIRMPPEGERLTQNQVKLLRKWIATGADFPKETSTAPTPKVTSSHWSFQPLAMAESPEVQDASWPRSTIDNFIQVQREAAGLKVAPDAEPVRLIRRAYYGLTGLPPTPEEVGAFLEATQSQGVPSAFRGLVDQLLTRPSYGERWGRHWMDWVRYADTAGDNSDFPIPQAYLYRNYIIDSFNDDLPYDRFLTEQLAGDLLPADTQAERNRLNIATGYLAMARRFGSLLERYPWHLTIEDTIDNMGRTMLGLTVSCARCHDHKFDPISTRDYYGLYGIFASTHYAFPGLELFQAQRDLVPLIAREEAAALLEPFRAEADELAAELEKHLTACEARRLENAAKQADATLAEQRKMEDELDAMLLKARRAGEALAEHLKKIPDMPRAYAVRDGKPQDACIQIKGEPDRPGVQVPRKFPDILGGQTLPEEVSSSSSGRLELAKWIVNPANPLTARVIVNRVWQRHFGSGLVPSTSDFGLRGEQPTHPELLDWLAGEFMRSGWSIKELHRQIMNSRTYQLSSLDFEENLASDPSNRYYWKFNRQRLDAESIRDTLLVLAGTLDPDPQTEAYPIPPQSEWKYTQHHPFKDDYASNKRSVYLMTKRLTAKPYFQTFDGPDPNVCTSDRDQSVTPLQALYFVNDEFLHEQAEHFSSSLASELQAPLELAQQTFAMILCRHPTAEETGMLLGHVEAVQQKLADDPQAEHKAWSSLTRSLLRLNEFLYVD